MRQSAAQRLGEKGFKRRGRGRKEVERKAAEEADPLDRAGSAEAENSSMSGPRPEGEHARNIDMHFELDIPERSAIERAIQREQQHHPAGSLKLTQREQSPDHLQTSALDLPSEAEEKCDSPKNEQRKSRFRALVEKKYGDSSLTAIDLATTHKQKSKFHLEGWNYAPTNKEVERWQKQWKKAQRAKDPREYVAEDGPSPREVIQRANASQQLSKEERECRRSKDKAKYEALKRELMLTTSGFAGAGIVISYFLSGVDTAASFAIGSLGAVVYLRLLGRKVDSKGPADGSGPDEQSEGGGGGGAAAPTLLVPAILFMIYNRWNALAAPQMEHYASLLPILLGFFSYKPSTLVRAYRDLTDDEDESPRSSSDREREENAREDEKQVTT